MMLNDRVIESMKEQMVPSDDVIESLLAKINEIDNSSESNVVQFKEPKIKEFKYKAKRPIYTYVASCAAAVLVIVSCFSIFGTGDDLDQIQSGIDKIVNDPTVVTQNEDKEVNTQPVIVDSKDPSVDEQDGQKEEEKNNEEADEKKPSKIKEGILGKIVKNNKEEKNDASNKEKTPDVTTTNPDRESVDEPVKVENNKPEKVVDTPEPVKEEQLPETWTKEILAEDQVSQVTIKGTNYVVGDTSSVITTSKISKISLDVEYDAEKYNVEATTKEIANVSPNFAVALTSGDIGGTVVYLNKDYSPVTLGELVNDAGLLDNLSFSQAKLFDNRVGYTPVSSISTSNAASAFKKAILSNSEASIASGYDKQLPYVFMVSPASKNSTGVAIAFEVSASGYLKVKVNNDATYVFDIGIEVAENFINLVG